MTDDSSSRPRIGQIVQSLCGRDQGQFAVIIKLIDDRYVLIADGDKRKFDNPKKKNINHLQLEDEIAQEIVDSLSETNRVTNGKLRFVIQRFIEKQTDA